MVYYLPHHPVIRNDKQTAKLRIVFDVSSKEKNCYSLNDNLLSGPNLNPNLLILLLKFREFKIGIIADCEKPFLQLLIDEHDRDYLRFLWSEQFPPKKIEVFRNRTVTFGVKSSTFLLAGTIKYHIKNYKESHPLACKVLNKNLYVDDLITGTNTIEDGLLLSRDAKLILKDASINLRKWKSNSKELCQKWQDTKFEKYPSEETVPLKVWNTLKDKFNLDLKSLIDSLENVKNTKRSVLRISSKLFDPMGYITAFTIRIKVLLQEIWEQGLEWDEEFGDILRLKWQKWYKEVNVLKELSLPRYYFHEEDSCSEVGNYKIIIFCDASEKAYGAIAYIRYERNQNFYLSFVTSKARVALLKKLSLPRLELMTTLIGSRLLDTLRKMFQINNNYILYSDSTIALSWIRGNANQWKTFISNRVTEIQTLTDPTNWKYIKGNDNPADIISRGCSANDLLSSAIVFNGPTWLTLTEENWPKNEENFRRADVDEEKRSKFIAVNYASENNVHDSIFDIHKFSSIEKVFRLTAWIRRFITNLRVKEEDRIQNVLTAEELEEAENFWLRHVQARNYSKDIDCLKEGQHLQKCSKIRDLNPFISDKGILLVGGRLQHSNLNYYEKHPILLPSKTKFTELIVKEAHEKTLHSGISDTLTI
nr:uncharacterized protein LOC107448485 [Parasteatoda tepidariorum]